MVRLIRTVALDRALSVGSGYLRPSFDVRVEQSLRNIRNGSDIAIVRKGNSLLIVGDSTITGDQQGESDGVCERIRFSIEPSAELASRVQPCEPGHQWLFVESDDLQSDVLENQEYPAITDLEDTWIVEVRASLPAKTLRIKPPRPKVRLEVCLDSLNRSLAAGLELKMCDADERRTRLQCFDPERGLFGKEDFVMPSRPGSARLTAYSKEKANKDIPVFERALFLKLLSKDNKKTVQARLKLNEEEQQALAEQGVD